MIIEIKVERRGEGGEGEIFFFNRGKKKRKEGRRQLGRKIVVTIIETR